MRLNIHWTKTSILFREKILFSKKNSGCSVRDILLVPRKKLRKFTYKIIYNLKKKYNTHEKKQIRHTKTKQHAKKSQKVSVKNKTVEKSKKCKRVFSKELFTFYEDKKHGKKIDE